MSNRLCSTRNSIIFSHTGDLSEFCSMINLCPDCWFDTSHQWTLAWFYSLQESLVLAAFKWKVATCPFHVPWSIHLKFSQFTLEVVQSQDHWTIQPKVYHFCGCMEPVLRLCCKSGSVWEPLTFSVSKFMMTLHIGDVLMEQKWHYFTIIRSRSFYSQNSEKHFNTLREEEYARIKECEVKTCGINNCEFRSNSH